MGFCTQCGDNLDEHHRFCRNCGSPVDPTKESEQILEKSETILQEIKESTLPKPEFGQVFQEDTVDRKTLFDDGLLVLTSKNLILYSSDEKDELKRIPISSIESASYSTIRRGLLIKRRINEENNFQSHLTQRQVKFSDLKSKKEFYENELRTTRIRVHRQEIKEKIVKLDEQLSYLAQEIRDLQSDPTKIQIVQKKVADTKKEVFHIVKNFGGEHTPREEYKIWEYTINRRIQGISKIKIETLPYDAVITINNTVVGVTPITIDKPLIDEAILDGTYKINILKESCEPVSFKVTTALNKGSFIENLELKERKEYTPNTDDMIDNLRNQVQDRSIDLSFYEIDREIEGKNETLLLTRDEILILTKNKEQCLYEIPYGAVNEAKYDKGILRGSKAVKINYNEKNFQNLVFNFWIDDQEGKISSSELKQRSESLVEILNHKRKESQILDIPRRIRSPNYFIITESDIQNNFSRFEPFEFERLIAKLFEKKGYKTKVTQERGDFGVDVIAESGKEKIAIQVKHWQAAVGGPDVHKTLGSMMTFGANRAMVITSSDFTNQAYEIQKRGSPIELWNGSRLRDEFRQYLLDAIDEAKRTQM